MVDRLGFVLMAVVLLPLGLYALINPRGAKRQNADCPYFKTGFAKMPLWFFRAVGIVALGCQRFLPTCFGFAIFQTYPLPELPAKRATRKLAD
jgi:hypothetical protein